MEEFFSTIVICNVYIHRWQIVYSNTHTHIYIYIHINIYIYSVIEGNLEVKLPTIWADEKQRWEESEKRRRKRKNQKKEDPGARKGGKATKHCVSPIIWGSGGSKSRLAKAAGAEPAGTVVARSTFPSQKCTKHLSSGALLEVEMSKKVPHRSTAKHVSKSKCTKHFSSGALLEVAMSNKCTVLWREAHLEVNMLKTPHARTTFWRSDCRFAWQAHGIVHLVKSEQKREGVVACSKTMAGVGHLKRIYKDAFSVAGAIQETCSSELLGGPGVDFLRGVAFWRIRSSGLLGWPCVTGAALRMTWHHSSWQAQYFRQVEWKNRTTHWYEAVSSALNFPFLKEVSQNCFVVDVVNFKNEEVSQNCFVFDVVKCKNGGSLAE